MKIRNGYVSNSSSSSFVIFGHKITNPLKSLKEGKRVFLYVEGAGTSGECEDWGMFIDEECLKLLNKSKWFDYRKDYSIFFECKNNFEEDKKDYDKVNVLEDIEGEEIFAFERDYSSPNTIKGLIQFLEEFN